MKAKIAPAFFLGGLALLFAQDNPPSHKVEQKGREFSTKEIVIRPGERIEFCNADEVAHNVFSKSSSNAFNIKTQLPGNSSIVEFKDEGSTEVRCAIHPTMKLLVHVRK
jgi:plastocyanin